jgi:hypothetical protein
MTQRQKSGTGLKSSRWLPEAIVLDFESALLNGEPSVEYYREDFRAISAAFAWRREDGTVKTKYTEGEDATRDFLHRIRAGGIPVIVHNFQFEYGVLAYRFPDYESVVSVDTMRLVQVTDNGGSKYASTVQMPKTFDDLLDAAEDGGDVAAYRAGLGLVASASRHLPDEWKEHKEPYHAWLRENAGVKKGQEGRNLTKLPPVLFEKYNVADAIVTLMLYETLVAKLAADGYDWNLDHTLYKGTAGMMALAKGQGLPVNRSALEAYVVDIEAELRGIQTAFRDKFAKEISEIEAARVDAYVLGLKTEKGRAKRQTEVDKGLPDDLRFNVGSNKQLAALFLGKLKIAPKFWTKPPKTKPGEERKKEFVPSPSFKAAHLATYGEGGTMLRQRRKRMLVLNQAKALLGLSRHDGLWHFALKACGTATGRFAGGNQ